MKLLNRFLAWVLALSMALSLMGLPGAMAAGSTPAEDAAVESAEQEATAEDAAAQSAAQEAPAEDAAAQSAAQENPAEQESSYIGTVTGFGELEVKEITMAERMSLGELLDKMPETLGVYLNGSDQLTQIPVSWYCPGGYEDSNDFYFQFSPAWDEDAYPVGEEMDVERDAPYVGVFLADLSQLSLGQSVDSGRRAVSPGSADEIFAFLTSDMGMNSAGACGVLANMHAESALNPRSSCKDINGKTSYGLCQWNGSRFERLRKWCSSNGEDYTTITGQLRYLNYELMNSYPKVYDHLMGVEDTDEGAYDAAYYWCYYYEQPASKGKRSKERGNLARNTYWASYGGSVVAMSESAVPVLTGVTTPEITVPFGQIFNLEGSIQCANALSEVVVGVYDAQGQLSTGVTKNPGTRIFSLSSVDSDVKFSKLSAGEYTYRIQAKAGKESTTLLEHQFTVARKKISNAKITLTGGKNALPAVKVTDGKTTLKKDVDYRVSFKAGSESGTGVAIILGKGNWAGKVRKTFQTAMQLEKEDAAQGEEAPAEVAPQDAGQEGVPTLSDPSLPGQELPQGSFVTVRGSVTSETNLTSVTAQVLREDGSAATGGSAQVTGKSYNLNKLDKKVGFSKLTAGRYTYQITAQTQGQTFTLLEHPFTVSPKKPAGVKMSKGKGAITVKWSKVSGAEGYEVKYARKANFSGARTTSAGSVGKKLTGLGRKKTYYVRVRSYVTTQSGELSYSPYSKTVKIKTK